MQINKVTYKESAIIFADNCISDLLDEWTCQEWDCSVQDFMNAYGKAFAKMAKQLGKEIAQEDKEDA